MVGNLVTDERLRDLMVRNRVVIQTEKKEMAPRRSDRSAIVSRVPDIFIDSPAGRLEASEYKLRLEDADGSLTFRARLDGARAATDSNAAGARAVDEKGGRVVLSSADVASRTIRLHVALDHLEIVRKKKIADPFGFLINRLIEVPMKTILATDGPPRIGPDVQDGLQALFPAGRMRDEESCLKKELAFLERFSPARFAERFSGRIREITERLDVLKSRRNPPELQGAHVAAQLSMMSRMVWRRACSAIRLEGTRVTVSVNPNPEVGRRGREGVEFRIQYQPHQFMPDVLVWTRSGRFRNRPRCLGTGLEFLACYQKDRDLFGMIDIILNYIDTTRVGAHRRTPVHMPPRIEELIDNGRDFVGDLF